MDVSKNEQGLYEVTVDGDLYEFEKWGAELALETLLDIGSVIGKPLGAALAEFQRKRAEGGVGLIDLDVDAAAAVAEELSNAIGTHKKLCMTVIRRLTSERCFCKGKKVAFDLHYQDRLEHMFNVLRAALEVQYGNFFGDLSRATGIRLEPRGKAPAPAASRPS